MNVNSFSSIVTQIRNIAIVISIITEKREYLKKNVAAELRNIGKKIAARALFEYIQKLKKEAQNGFTNCILDTERKF